MKVLYTLLLVLLVGVFTSCATFTENSAQQLRIGMTQNEVINKLGKEFTVLSGDRIGANTVLEVWQYRAYGENQKYYVYTLNFVNGVLEKWDRHAERNRPQHTGNQTSGSRPGGGRPHSR